MKMIPATEFKAHCLRIIAEVNATGEPVTITKHGKPVVVVEAPSSATPRRAIVGAMAGTVVKYERPFDPAADPDEWAAIAETGSTR